MILPEPPHAWGTDKITDFIDNTRFNSYATYTNLRTEYNKLTEVDNVFRELINNLNNTKDWFTALFVLRAHSSFLAGSHLGMSGQAPESYAMLRLCMENGLYGLHIHKNPETCEIWLKRHDSAEAKRRVQNEFTIKRLFETITACDRKEAKLAKDLYDWCIDFGGHPNESAFTQSLKMDEGHKVVKFDIIYLTGDEITLRCSLKIAAQVGASVLGIFKIVFKERYDITGLTNKLYKARHGL